LIYLLATADNTVKRMQHDNNEPLGFDDFYALIFPTFTFPHLETDEVDMGVIPAHGGNLLLVPMENFPEDTEDGVRANQPATSHSKWGNEHPVLSDVAILITDIADLQNEVRTRLTGAIEDGFIDARWGIGTITPKEHDDDCPLGQESHRGLTYIVTGEKAGTYSVSIMDDDDDPILEYECTNDECGAVFYYHRESQGEFVPPNFCPHCGHEKPIPHVAPNDEPTEGEAQ
jgi:hypothetical protein